MSVQIYIKTLDPEPLASVSDSALTPDGREHLMWCTDDEFDRALHQLSQVGLLELIQLLQDAMLIEQQTFDSLQQQLEAPPVVVRASAAQRQRLSAALCTSQTRLTRLCGRSMRCFTQQAMRARQRVDQPEEPEAGSPPAEPAKLSSNFRQNLSFFQKAAQNLGGGAAAARASPAARRSSVGSDGSSAASAEQADEEDFESVLFVNGRPRYVTSEASAAPIGGGGAPAAAECGASAAGRRADCGDGGRAERSAHSAQKVRIGGTAAERIRAGAREAADRSGSRSPARHVREQDSPPTASAGESATAPATSRREKAAPATRDKSSGGGSKRDGAGGGREKAAGKRERDRPREQDAAGDRTASASAPQRESAPPRCDDVQPPRRRPYIRFGSVENHLSHDDLTYFKQTIGIVPAGGGITRTQSCHEGLDVAPTRPTVSRTLSVSSLADVGVEPHSLSDSRAGLRRAPSVEEILESVKALRARRQEEGMVRGSEPEAEYQNVTDVTSGTDGSGGGHKSRAQKTRPTPWSGVQFSGPARPVDADDGVEPADDACYENVTAGQAVYQNAPPPAEIIYDQPVKQRRKRRPKTAEEPHQLYENVQFSEPAGEYQNVTSQPTYTNLTAAAAAATEHDSVYENVEKGPVVVSGNGVVAGTYDVPRTASHIYDAPQRTRVKNVPPAEAGEYDAPRPTYAAGQPADAPTPTAARATQIVLKGKPPAGKAAGAAADCDGDSLEGEAARRPDIPSPDYASDAEDVDGIPNDYIGDDQLDEGLGESDARSYYNEDPGLEVILEEPEDEYVTSSEEEEESAQRRSLRSLEGSEGIGSAEGDSGSNASVESSGGVHIEGGSPTLRPPTPEEREERTQKDRCVEVYPETMRQRKQARKHKQVDAKQWPESKEGSRREETTKALDSPSKIKKLLPSVKALKSQFESVPDSDAPRPRAKDKAPSPPKQGVRQVAPSSERSRPTDGSTGDSAAPRTASPQRSSVSPQRSSVSPQRSSVSPQRSSAPRTTSPQRSSASPQTSSASPQTSSASPQRSSVSPQRPSAPTQSRSGSGGTKKVVHIADDPVEIIYDKFQEVDERLLKQRITTLSWNPTSLVSRLYEVPQPASRPTGQQKGYVNIEGWLEKLPSGRKKATFWNAWKRRYFKAKDGFLYYYQTNTTEKPSMVLQLMGGNVESMDSSVVGIDDGKGHYVVVRCSSHQEAERWARALLTHTVEDYDATYVQPVALPPTVATSRRCVVIDLGSSSIRAGVLQDQPTLPQLFFPAAMVTSRDGKPATFGAAALRPEARAAGVLSFPLRPSSKITKYSVDVAALAGLLQLTFRELRVSPADYSVQLSLPRSFNTATLGEILRLLFDTFGTQGVNLTHQSILAMWSYNATSGVVVDVGDRMDVVPVIDGYIVEGGVSRVPYGGVRIQDHLRHFLLQKHFSLVTEVESLVLRYVMERLCFVSEHYSADMEAFDADPASLEKSVSVKEFLGDNVSWRRVGLDVGRFQAAEGLFSPDAWGLDNKGVHKLVHKAVQECSVDIRKEMVRSIYLAGGVTLLPGFAERLQLEMDKLTPPSVTPKVHASPYRYHAAYLGACVLAGSDGFRQAMVTRDSWLKLGINALKKWTV